MQKDVPCSENRTTYPAHRELSLVIETEHLTGFQVVSDTMEIISSIAWMIQVRIGNRGTLRHLFLNSKQAYISLAQDAMHVQAG
jgi:hypothetical protein